MITAPLAAITALSVLGYDTSFAHLDLGFNWVIGYKSRLWLGLSRTYTELFLNPSCVVLAVCLGSLSCWKVNLRPSLRSWALWTKFSLRISLLCSGQLSLTPDQSPCPCRWNTLPQHDAATTMLHRWCGSTGQVMSDAWFHPDVTLRIKAKETRESFLTVWGLIHTWH